MAESFFFPAKQTASLDPIMLLSGPPSCSHSTRVRRTPATSLFSSARSKDWRENPLFLHRYVDDYEGVKKYFAAFHLQDTYPSAVIIDDFGDLFDDRSCQLRYGNARGRELAVSRTLAMCHETIKQVNGRLHPNGNCKLLLSDAYQGDGPRLLFLYKRWIPRIFVVKGDGLGSFTMKMNCSSSSSGSKSNRSAKYSIALQHLALENIIDE